MDVKMKNIKNEYQLKKWFEKNFKKLGYYKIIRKDIGKFPDFIMLKNNKKVGVELETLSSNFILHNHDKRKVDEVICIKNDIEIGIPTREIKQLNYIPEIVRISATVDEKTLNNIKILLRNGNYRNMSHVIESAIILFGEKYGKKKK